MDYGSRTIISKSFASSSLDGAPGHLIAVPHHLAGIEDVHVDVDARWDDIRQDPRFQSLVRTVGLP